MAEARKAKRRKQTRELIYCFGMNEVADEIPSSEGDDVDSYLAYLYKESESRVSEARTPVMFEAADAAPVQERGVSSATALPFGGRKLKWHVIQQLHTSSLSLLRDVLTHRSMRCYVVTALLWSVISVACWQRQLFEALRVSEPPVVIAAVVIGKTLFCSLLLLLAHCLCGVGVGVERFLYDRWILVAIAACSFASTVTAAYSLSAMSWQSAVILNPLGFAPLFYLLLSRLLGLGVKRLPRSAFFIITAAILALCVGLIRGIADHSMTQTGADGKRSLGEGAGCLLGLVSGALLGAVFALYERHSICYPTSPLYVVCASGFLEVALLPIVIFVDMLPVIGTSATAWDAVQTFFSLHRSSIPAALISVVALHTCVHAVAIPLLTRAPSLLVPMFAVGPLIAASVFPGPPLPVVIGGLYAFVVIILLLASEPEYDEDRLAPFHRQVRIVPGKHSVLVTVWRHGSSVLSLQVEEGRESPAGVPWYHTKLPWWWEMTSRFLCFLGWAPLSSAYPGRVVYTKAVHKRTRRDRYGYNVLRYSGVNAVD